MARWSRPGRPSSRSLDHLAVLSRRGFVTPQPQKRPRSSFVRFEAAQPNERWQADITHWAGMHTPIEYEKLHTYPTAVA